MTAEALIKKVHVGVKGKCHTVVQRKGQGQRPKILYPCPWCHRNILFRSKAEINRHVESCKSAEQATSKGLQPRQTLKNQEWALSIGFST